jgi:lysophospholipase L1-like esterase
VTRTDFLVKSDPGQYSSTKTETEMIKRRPFNWARAALLSLPFALLAAAISSEGRVQAQEVPATTAEPATIPIATSLLQDTNGNGILELAAFGDSITRGMGDNVRVGEDVESGTLDLPTSEAGYPLRLERILGIQVTNLGDPGEQLVTAGLPRFTREILSHHYDVVFLMEGTNDSFAHATANTVRNSYQTIVNIARMANTNVIMLAMPPVCCGHAGLARFVDTYRDQAKFVAAVNGLALSDVNHAFRNTCNVGDCYLLNLPEGLHPNTKGYDIISEAVLATIFKIDLFAPTGPATLEATLLLPPGSVQTEPDPVSAGSPPARTDDSAEDALAS